MSDELSYELVEGWEQLPAGFTHLDVAGVAVDANDRVYLITRMQSRVLVYEQDGTFVASWGEEVFTPRTHCIRFASDGVVYTVDDGDHTVRKFAPDGTQLMMIGTPGVASDTGYDKDNPDSHLRVVSIQRGGPPFNKPTAVALAPNGEIYVSDGYGNARVHRFSSDGELIQSWGEPGIAPGEFHLPHDICVRPDGTVMVADRENDRIQFFSPSGEFLHAWTHVQRPCSVCMDRDGLIYVSELACTHDHISFVHGEVKELLPGRVSVLAPDGSVLARWGGPDMFTPGNFFAPHAIAVDSRGDIYVAEVAKSYLVDRKMERSDYHTFQKFRRKGGR